MLETHWTIPSGVRKAGRAALLSVVWMLVGATVYHFMMSQASPTVTAMDTPMVVVRSVPHAAEAPAASDDEATALEHNLSRMASLWREQHHGVWPNFKEFPNWEQFVKRTGENGVPAAFGALGPYAASTPVNPRNKLRIVSTMMHEFAADEALPEAAGFVFNAMTGEFHATDESGLRLPRGAPARIATGR